MNALTEDDRIAVMIYVDAEMPAGERTAFDARLVHEPALAAAVARERALRATLQSAYGPVMDEPVPAGLLDLLGIPDGEPAPAAHAANDPVAIGRSDARRAHLPRAQHWHRQWQPWGAMAACLVLGVVFGTRMYAPQSPAIGGADTVALNVRNDGAITAQGGLRVALEQRVAGTVLDPNSPITVGLTFRNHAQQYCRTFTLDSASSGIACRQSDGWVVAHLEHAAGTPASAIGAYRTAASPYSPTLLQAIDALRDGDTLDATAETAAKAKGWKP
jgi:hypothetical protein